MLQRLSDGFLMNGYRYHVDEFRYRVTYGDMELYSDYVLRSGKSLYDLISLYLQNPKSLNFTFYSSGWLLPSKGNIVLLHKSWLDPEPVPYCTAEEIEEEYRKEEIFFSLATKTLGEYSLSGYSRGTFLRKARARLAWCRREKWVADNEIEGMDIFTFLGIRDWV